MEWTLEVGSHFFLIKMRNTAFFSLPSKKAHSQKVINKFEGLGIGKIHRSLTSFNFLTLWSTKVLKKIVFSER